MATDIAIPQDIARILVDPRAYATDELHEAYAALRRDNPLGGAEVEGFDPFWVVTKHADILTVSRQNDLFHNGDRATTLIDQAGDRRAREITGGSPHLVRSLVQMDAPDHPKYRMLTQGWFMPQSVKKLEDMIRGIARASVDRMAAKGGACDFVADVALGYPLHVVMSLLGVPQDDEPRMLRLTQELFGAQDPDTARAFEALTAEQLAQILHAVVEDFTRYFSAISANRRAAPRDDLATLIATALIDGQPISEREAAGYSIIVATAGHDTTSSSIAGGMTVLAESPDLLARLKADPALIPAFVEEAIRWTTPVKTFMRSATADTVLREREIASGDWLMLCYASGNRDEDVFEAPFAFRLDRKPNKQLAFGYGAHACLGQHLAKLEMRIFFEELQQRLVSVSLAGEPKMTESWFVNGPKRVPIGFVMT